MLDVEPDELVVLVPESVFLVGGGGVTTLELLPLPEFVVVVGVVIPVVVPELRSVFPLPLLFLILSVSEFLVLFPFVLSLVILFSVVPSGSVM